MRHARPDYNRFQDPEGLIPEDEPVFLIRGKDAVGPETLRNWADSAARIGAGHDIVQAAREQADEMERWQAQHGSKVADL